MTNTAPVYRYLRQHQLTRTNLGQLIVIILLIQDIFMCVILAIPDLLTTNSLLSFVLRLGHTCGVFLFVLALGFGLYRHLIPIAFSKLTTNDNDPNQVSQLRLLSVVALCFTMSLVTEALGLSLEVGAFVAGLAFCGSKGNLSQALTSISILEHLFGSLFFASIGMLLNMQFLLAHFVEALSLLVTISFLKVSMAIIALMMIQSYQLEFRHALNMALYLSHVRSRVEVDSLMMYHKSFNLLDWRILVDYDDQSQIEQPRV